MEKELNQCDGCMAGIPVDENNRHKMGDERYANYMICEKKTYQTDKPSDDEITKAIKQR